MLKKSSTILSAHDLRHSLTDEIKESAKKFDRNNIHIVLDNIVDAYNIGSAFRIADSIFAQKVWICGKNIVTPLDRQVQKSSVNTCDLIEWETLEETKEIFNHLDTGPGKAKTFFLSLEKINDYAKYGNILHLRNVKDIWQQLSNQKDRLCIIIGSESFGINQEVLEWSDAIVEIPMYGINNSMNVINALAILTSHLTD